MTSLAGKTAIITGAASGIGAAAVELFLTAGANVVAVDRTAPGAPPALLTRFPQQLAGVVGDVALEATALTYTQTALDHFGRIDVIVNNAGVALVKKLHEHSEAEWDRIMNINVKSLLWAARSVVPVMQRQGGGVFLNIGSISSVCGMRHQGAYGPSKGAVIQLTRQMAIEYARDGIRANAVCPGTVETPLLLESAAESGHPQAFLQGLAEAHPIGRIAAASEIAEFLKFLASDDARFITGAVLMIDGGYSAQ